MGSKEEEMHGLSNEQLKERLLGEPDEERACRSLQGDDETIRTAKEAESRMRVGVYAPSEKELEEAGPQIDKKMRNGEITVLIPMLEKGGSPNYTPRSVISYFVENCQIPKSKIIVVDGGSGEEALEEVRSWNIPMISFRETVYRIFRPLMCGILSLPSEKFRGKGIQVALGFLVIEMMKRMGINNSSLVHLHDSELSGVDEYNGTRHELFPLVTNPEKHLHSQAIQIGRNNEAVHNARVAMQGIMHMHPDSGVRRYLEKIWERYVSLVWMCTGERIVNWEMLMSLPMTTGYCMEAALVLGTIGYDLERVGDPAQVVIPNPRLDGANGSHMEQIMMNMISRFMLTAVMTGTPPHQWNLGLISELNYKFEEMPFIPMLPKEAGGVVCHPVSADRIIPSTNTLLDQGFVDTDELKRMVEECILT